jgi:hypothetical protein
MTSESFADVSHHQESVDLAAYARAGFKRIGIKATEGVGYTDPMFRVRWQKAGQLGLARLVYHFGKSGDGAAEWASFIGTIKAAGGLTDRDLLCLDSEDPGKAPRAAAHAAAFTRAAVADGHSGSVYTGNWYANGYLKAAHVEPSWRRLWLSDYTPGQADADIELPDGWTRDQVIARQYTSSGSAAGIPGCDMSRLFIDWIGGSDPTSKPPSNEEDDDMATIQYVRDDSGKIYEANLGAGTYWHVPNPAVQAARKALLAGKPGVTVLAVQANVDDMGVYGVELGA